MESLGAGKDYDDGCVALASIPIDKETALQTRSGLSFPPLPAHSWWAGIANVRWTLIDMQAIRLFDVRVSLASRVGGYVFGQAAECPLGRPLAHPRFNGDLALRCPLCAQGNNPRGVHDHPRPFQGLAFGSCVSQASAAKVKRKKEKILTPHFRFQIPELTAARHRDRICCCLTAMVFPRRELFVR